MITDTDKLDLLHSDLQDLQEILKTIALNQEKEIEKLSSLENMFDEFKKSFRGLVTGNKIRTFNMGY